MFAAWLITTADAAQGAHFEAAELVKRVADVRAKLMQNVAKEATTSDGSYLDAADGVTIGRRCTFLPLEQARELAAGLVALAHLSSDLRPVFDRIAAVHAVVKDGSALTEALADPRTMPVDLLEGKRHRVVAVGSTFGPSGNVAETVTAEEVGEESPTAVERRKAMKP
jgi:hypothetical protein